MKRIALIVVAICLAVVFSGIANAQQPVHTAMKGKLGIGYTLATYSLGVKMWMSDSFALDIAASFDTAAVATNFAINVGANIALMNKENLILQLRPGIIFDIGGNGAATVTNLWFPILLNAEYFLSKSFSVQTGIGIEPCPALSPATSFRFFSTVTPVGVAGVFVYF